MIEVAVGITVVGSACHGAIRYQQLSCFTSNGYVYFLGLVYKQTRNESLHFPHMIRFLGFSYLVNLPMKKHALVFRIFLSQYSVCMHHMMYVT